MIQALWPVVQQFQNKNGSNLVSGKVYIYYQGRTALATTYHDEDGTVVNSNPVLLDNNGRATAFADTAYAYTIVVCDYYGKELFSQDITLHDVTETADEITLIGSNGSIHIDTSTSGGVKTFDLSANTDILATKQSVDDLDDRVTDIESNKKDKQSAVSFTGSATKTVKSVTQNANGEVTVEFEDIDLPQEVPNVNVTSSDSSITVTTTVDAETNTKTFDLSVANDTEVEYGRFIASNVTSTATLTKTRGNLELSDNKIQLKKGSLYHFTIRGSYRVTTLSNTLQQLSFIEYSTFNPISVNVDNSISDTQFFELSFDVVANNDIAYPVMFTVPTNAEVNSLVIDIHSVVAGTSSSSGSSDNDKVAVDDNATPGYLEDVLVSDSDLVSLVKSGNQLRVNVNTEYTSDPKLSTMNESQIDSATSNYGSYSLNTGITQLEWNDTTYTSYSWLNAQVYQMMRLSDAQGTITKANLALCGSLSFYDPAPCFNVGIFDAVTGTLLGQSGLKYYGTDFNSDQELCTVDMIEETEGSLNIKRNFKYIVMVWTCGLQLAGMDKSTSYNYTYDLTLRQNLEGTIQQPVWPAITDLANRASAIPYVTFGASAI